MSSSSPGPSPASGGLARRLGLGDAVVIGLAAMIGAGIFSALAPAAGAAGSLMLVALVVAAVVAFANATSSAQLAAQYPSAGGTYVYGRERLGEWWGFAAGWCFVIGKTASCAAMALAFAAYAVPPEWQRPVAALAVVALVGVNAFGITRTARLARVLVVAVLAVLALVAASGLVPALGGGGGTGATLPAAAASGPGSAAAATRGAYGVLQAAGLLFFAFAGYARIATLGEEVRDPARTIPRAIALAFGIALALYALIAVVSLTALGPDRLAVAADPLVAVVQANGWPWAAPIVRVGAALACLGALLALIAGVGRTTLAMARQGDLPRMLAAVHPRHQVPRRAELVLGAVVVVTVLSVDLRGAIGFSSFGVLLYYFVANVAAFTQGAERRRYPRALQIVGAVGCVVLVVTLPLPSVVAGAAVVAVGLAGRALLRPRTPSTG